MYVLTVGQMYIINVEVNAMVEEIIICIGTFGGIWVGGCLILLQILLFLFLLYMTSVYQEIFGMLK